MNMEITAYGGWQNCVKLSNGEVELIATTDVGPRIIRYGFVGEQNELKEFEDHMGKTGGDEWRSYGGHRLWHAPEVMPRTYAPDNEPVPYEWDGKWLSLNQNVEQSTGVQKQINVFLAESGSHVKLVHRITNQGPWAIELSAWVLSVMAPGGKAIFPQEPFATHPEALLPARPLALWAYTQLNDPRWALTAKYVQLRQDSNTDLPQKIGALNKRGWAAYHRNSHLFMKRFNHIEGATYPDFGSNFETFTNEEMLELETLSPLTRLEPGATVDHTEHWFLFNNVPDGNTDNELDAIINPLLDQSAAEWK